MDTNYKVKLEEKISEVKEFQKNISRSLSVALKNKADAVGMKPTNKYEELKKSG